MSELLDMPPLGADFLLFGRDVPSLLVDPRDGSAHVNRDKLLTGWRWRPAKVNGVYPYALGATETGVDFVIPYDAQSGEGEKGVGDQEVSYFWCGLTTSTDRVAVTPIVGAPIAHDLSNVPISSNLVFGTPGWPGYLPSSIYGWADSDFRFRVSQLSGATKVSMGTFCRTFAGGSPPELQALRRRTDRLAGVHPYWVGPFSLNSSALSGPEISLAPGADVEIRFPCEDGDFVTPYPPLDDSTSTSGVEAILRAHVYVENGDGSRRALTDWPKGVNWRRSFATPTDYVTGVQGGVLRAMSAKKRQRTLLVKEGGSIVVHVMSDDTGTVTFRAAFLGWRMKLGRRS